MTHTLTATDARIRFGRLLDQVARQGDTVIVERAGEPQAVVIPLAEYERLRQLEERQESWEEHLDQLLLEVDEDLRGKALPPAEDMIRQMRKKRDAELMGLR